MPLTIMCGDDFSVSSKRARFFDVQGEKLDSDTWAFEFGNGQRRIVYPSLISEAIRECIEIDTRNGRASDIAQIKLHQTAAVSFCLEGMLGPELFDEVEVCIGRSVRLPGFWFDGVPLGLIVVKNLDQDVQTADMYGTPI